MTSNESTRSQSAEFVIDYEPGLGWYPSEPTNEISTLSFTQFKQELEQALSPLLSQKPAHSLHSISISPWLDLALIFTSTTVATSLLSKVSEDVYSRLKQKILSGKTRIGTHAPMRLTVQIKVDDRTLVLGSLESTDYKEAMEALASLSQMLVDASGIKREEFHEVDESPLGDERRSGYIVNKIRNEYGANEDEEGRYHTESYPKPPIAAYTYDPKEKKWVMRG